MLYSRQYDGTTATFDRGPLWGVALRKKTLLAPVRCLMQPHKVAVGIVDGVAGCALVQLRRGKVLQVKMVLFNTHASDVGNGLRCHSVRECCFVRATASQHVRSMHDSRQHTLTAEPTEVIAGDQKNISVCDVIFGHILLQCCWLATPGPKYCQTVQPMDSVVRIQSPGEVTKSSVTGDRSM